MRRKAFLLLSCLLIVGSGFFSNASFANGFENVNTEFENGDSYYFIQFNGDEHEVILNENVTLTLAGWTDESKTFVNGQIDIHTEETNKVEDITFNVTDALSEIVISEDETFRYRIDVSDFYSVKEILPVELRERVALIAENENGTSVEQVEIIDEFDTVIINKGLSYYKTNENKEKVSITKEEYDSLNVVTENETENQSTIITANNTEGATPSVTYSTHVEDIGWQTAVTDGEMSGTEGQAKRLESIKISVNNVQDLGVRYTTHVQDQGWGDFVSNGAESGSTGKARRLEGIKIELTGTNAQLYDIYYRVHAEYYGWMNWVKNGELAGTTGEAKRLEAIEIMVLAKGSTPPITSSPSVTYKSHVQDYGWLESVSDGALSGTVGKGKQLEALQISLKNNPYSGGITYKTHVQDFGWLDNVSDGATSGTIGKGKQVEAIQVNLTGEMAQHYDVYYRVHAETFGWLSWAKNGGSAGTQGLASQLEAIEVVLIKKGGQAPGSTDKPFITKPSVVYSTHVETYGWMGQVADGVIAGTQGQAKRLEAIKISLQNAPYSGDIVYSTHVQSLGWLSNVSNGALSGSEGKGLRLEAIKIHLTGEIANYFDVYYRVHAEEYGWLGWAKNGMNAGSEGLAKRLEAVEIKLVPKGQAQPVDPKTAYKQPLIVFLDPGHGGYDPGSVAGGYHEADLNLTVAKKVQSILLSRGYRVYMSRYDDSYVDLLERSRMANALSPDIFISIHHNSSAGTTTTEGLESYYYQYKPEYQPKINFDMHNNPERIAKSVSLTNIIHNKILGYSGAKDRGVGSGSFSVVRESAMPSTLLELGFINNPTERQRLVTDSYQNKLAAAIADGIDMYFSIN